VSDSPKVTPSHLRRAAVIYVRQSTLAQVDRNRESTALYGARTGRTWCELAFRNCHAGSGAWLFGCCT
jgi:hypothetical protein